MNLFNEGEPRNSETMVPDDSNAQGDLGRDPANTVQLPNGSVITNDYFGTLDEGFYGFSGGLVIECGTGVNGDACEGDSSDAFTFSIASGFEVTSLTFSSQYSLLGGTDRGTFDSFGLTAEQNNSDFGATELGRFVELVDNRTLFDFDIASILGQGNFGATLGEGVYTFGPFFDLPFQGVFDELASIRWSIGVQVIDNNPQVTPVPLPAGLVLMISGLGALGFAGRVGARNRRTSDLSA